MRHDKKIKAAFVFILILGAFLTYLYLIGTITFLSTGQTDLPLGFIQALKIALSNRGILFLISISALLFVYIFSLRHKKTNKKMDPRGFYYSDEGDHGTAGWLTEKEMKEVLDLKPVNKTDGIILGEFENKIVSLPADTYLNKHMMIIGAPGTMKSRAIVRNNLFQIIKREESVVITDPKGEMYTDTASLFQKAGYMVRVFNLKNPDQSDRWNALSRLSSDDLSEIQILAGNIINNTTDGAGFWDDGALNLLTALMLYKMSDPDEKEHSLPAVYRMISTYTLKEITALFDRLPLSHPAKVPFKFFSDASDTVKASHYTGLGVRLQILQNPKVCRILEGKGMDLLSLGKRKCAYFVIMSDNDSTLKFVSSMFFSSLIKKLSDYADTLPKKRLNVPVNFWLDEFNNIGKIGASEDGSDFARAQSVIRSRSMNLILCVQSLGQLQNRYPKNVWAELLGNCDTVLMLGCNDEITANYVSKRSGLMTIIQGSTAVDRKTIAAWQMIPSYRETESKSKRYLLTEDEVYTLPPDEMIVIIRSKKIFKLKKFDYIRHPAARAIIQKDPDLYRSEKLLKKKSASFQTDQNIREGDPATGGPGTFSQTDPETTWKEGGPAPDNLDLKLTEVSLEKDEQKITEKPKRKNGNKDSVAQEKTLWDQISI